MCDSKSTTPAPVTATRSVEEMRADLNCPSWCRGTFSDHEQYVEAGDLVIEHEAPPFGPFKAIGDTVDGRVVHVSVLIPGLAGYDAARLRQVAKDALAAAEWLDEQLASSS